MPTTFGHERIPTGPSGHKFVLYKDMCTELRNETEDTVDVVVLNANGTEWLTVYVDKRLDCIDWGSASQATDKWWTFMVRPKIRLTDEIQVVQALVEHMCGSG